MTLLSVKAIIYRNTHIYLAHKEKLDYVMSQEFRNNLMSRLKYAKDNNYSTEFCVDLSISDFDIENGFYAPLFRWSFKWYGPALTIIVLPFYQLYLKIKERLNE
jgi:hypothetical protein